MARVARVIVMAMRRWAT
jgi:hypothetical protein